MAEISPILFGATFEQTQVSGKLVVLGGWGVIMTGSSHWGNCPAGRTCFRALAIPRPPNSPRLELTFRVASRAGLLQLARHFSADWRSSLHHSAALTRDRGVRPSEVR